MTSHHDAGISLSTAEADAAVEKLPYPRVTRQAIEAKVVDKTFFITKSLLTICVITMRNGFEFTGEAGCVDPRNYNPEIGQTYAYDAAIKKAWSHEGYLLRDMTWRANQLLPEEYQA